MAPVVGCGLAVMIALAWSHQPWDTDMQTEEHTHAHTRHLVLNRVLNINFVHVGSARQHLWKQELSDHRSGTRFEVA